MSHYLTHSCSLDGVMHRPVMVNQSGFVPEGHLAMSRGLIICHNRGWVGVLASDKLKSGMLLNTPCREDSPSGQSYPAPHVIHAKAEKVWHKLFAVSKGPLPILPPKCVFFMSFFPHSVTELPSLPMNSFGLRSLRDCFSGASK